MTPGLVEVDGHAVELNARPRAVLTALLLEANDTVSIERIARFIWGDDPPRTAHNSVARFVADLRRGLGSARNRIVTEGAAYRVEVQPGELDLDDAKQSLAEAQRLAVVDPNLCHTVMTQTLAVTGIVANHEFVDVQGATVAGRRLDEVRLAALDLYTELQLRRGDHHDLAVVIEQAVVAYPFHEGLWATLMIALSNLGRPTEALRAARRARNVLAEVGLEPSDEIKRLETQIAVTGRVDSTTGDPRPAPAGSVPNHGIIEPSTTLVGRAETIRELNAIVDDHHMVTVVGLGGSGKTRLALAAAKLRESRGTAVHRVGLRRISDPTLVLPTIAAAVGVPASSASTPAELGAALRRETFVLLVDNCEHVVEAARVAINEILTAAPGVRVVATSRIALGTIDERVYQLGMLQVPEPDEITVSASAVALFIDRAEQHLRAATAYRTTMHDICQVCRLLGGHPLSIELAAAQLDVMSTTELNQQVTAAIAAPGHTNEPAVAALDAMLEWSWELLSPQQQTLLARLSVFGGGWTLEAADSVCRDAHSADDSGIADNHAALVRSGLVASPSTRSGARFEMLDPVREFAIARLAERREAVVMNDRMVSWLQSRPSRWGIAELHSWAEPSVELRAEHGNVIDALAFLQSQGRTEDMAWLAIRASGMWVNHGFADQTHRWLAELVDNDELARDVRSAAAAMVLAGCHARGALDDLTHWGMRSIELSDGEAHDWLPAVVSFLSLWALIASVPMSSDDLRTMSYDLAERSRSAHTNRGLAKLYHAHVLFGIRDYEGALGLFAEITNTTEQPGRLLMVAEIGHALALFMLGRHDEAVEVTRQWRSNADTDDWHYALEIFRSVIVGGAGEAERATAMLAAAVRRFEPASVWGRADEIQTAFGLLAGMRGEHDLSDELLTSTVTRDVLLLATAVEHVTASRGPTDDASWFGVAQEFFNRVVPEDSAAALADNQSDLVTWWTSGPPRHR